jgi:hypothetical protein
MGTNDKITWANQMYRGGSGGWIEVVGLSLILVWYLSVQIPYLLRYLRRKNWPSADAIVQKGTIAVISLGRNSAIPACFMGYAFKVQGERYGAYFVVVGNKDALQKIHESLAGAPLQIRYNPSDPNVSLLADYKDFRFEGLKASQDPDWLNQAPTFDLQDAIRG